MSHTVEAIARATGLTLLGDGSVVVCRPAEPAAANSDDLALAMNPAYADELRRSRARAAVVWEGADWQGLGLLAALVAPRPRVALAGITAEFRHPPEIAPGIHPTAVIGAGAEIGAGAAIGPFAVIGQGARIGPRGIIGAHASVGSGALIGSDALLHAGTRIGARCRIGDRFIAQPNAVIGADGFSFEPPRRGVREGMAGAGSDEAAAVSSEQYLRIHSLAAVEIDDDVEVGAGSCVDRGTIAPTRIGAGTKIDNQVQIGHNVQVGRACLLCAQVGIAGSTTLGDRVVLGGKVGVPDHVTIGSDVMIAAGSLVAGNIPARSVFMGIPAVPRHDALRQFAAVRRLPRLLEQIAEIRLKLGL